MTRHLPLGLAAMAIDAASNTQTMKMIFIFGRRHNSNDKHKMQASREGGKRKGREECHHD